MLIDTKTSMKEIRKTKQIIKQKYSYLGLMNTKIFAVSILFIIICTILFFISSEDSKFILLLAITLIYILTLVFIKGNKSDEFYRNFFISIGFAITIASWFISGYLVNRQSVIQKKRELKVRLLLDAYYKLESSDRKGETQFDEYIYSKFAENAVTSIQLLGSKELVKAGRYYALSNATDGYSTLLVALRNELRQELNLEKLPDESEYMPYSFRILRRAGEKIKDSITSAEHINMLIKINELNQNLSK